MKIQTCHAPGYLTSFILLMLSLAATLAPGLAVAGSPGDDKLSTEIEKLKQGQEAMREDIAEIKKMLEQILVRVRPKGFQPVDLSLAGAPSLGTKDAPVTMVEFTDFQCQFCGRYFSNTLPEVITRYVDAGKLRYVIREMPLTNLHPYAQKAAEAALCADDEGKFWEMHDALFKDQVHLKPEDLAAHARELGLDMPKFSHCLESGMKTEQVQQDVKAGRHAEVHGTPTFYLGLTNPAVPDTLHATRVIRGAQPFRIFKNAIDALSALPPKVPGAGPSRTE